MAILQALLTLLGRSAGKVLNAIFGWAVRALFGHTTPRDQTVLSALVAVAIAWPLLLMGIIAPRVAALVLAFIPLSRAVPGNVVRLVWAALALLVPVVVGLTFASRAPTESKDESFVKRTLRGFPITLGLAAAFVWMFVTVPVLRFIDLVKRRQSVSISLLSDEGSYHQVAHLVCETLNRKGFQLVDTQPRWWSTAPMRILQAMGGKAFRNYVPVDLAHFEGPGLEISMYPTGLLLRGSAEKTSWAQGLVAEAIVRTDALQTVDPRAQEIERQIRRVWRLLEENPMAHEKSPRLEGRMKEVSTEMGNLHIPYDEWQVLYRQTLQTDRALDGKPPVLEQQLSDKRGEIPAQTTEYRTRSDADDPSHLPLGALVHQIANQAVALAKKQVELAITEMKADVKAEVGMAKGLGVTAIASLLALNALVVAGILALALVLPGWAAALIVAGVFLAVAGVAFAIGWKRRVTAPLRRTRESIKEDVRWSKERLA